MSKKVVKKAEVPFKGIEGPIEEVLKKFKKNQDRNEL